MSNILTQIRNLQVTDDFDFQTYKDDKEQKWDEDPLVLACALKSATGDSVPFSLSDPRVKEFITDEVRLHAEVVRKYYTKKFFWSNLSGNKVLSPFRQRLCYLLENRICETKDKDVGIYFKLPWFYDEDMVHDQLKQTLKTTDLPAPDFKVQPVAIRLTYVTSSKGWQAKRKVERFWFKDENDYLYGITIPDDNILLEMFKDIILKSKTHVFTTRIAHDRIDNMNYYRLFKFKLIGE